MGRNKKSKRKGIGTGESMNKIIGQVVAYWLVLIFLLFLGLITKILAESIW